MDIKAKRAAIEQPSYLKYKRIRENENTGHLGELAFAMNVGRKYAQSCRIYSEMVRPVAVFAHRGGPLCL
jgi:hypothetical protein